MTCPRYHFIVTIYDNGGSYSSDVGTIQEPNIWNAITDATLQEAVDAASNLLFDVVDNRIDNNEGSTTLGASEVIKSCTPT